MNIAIDGPSGSGKSTVSKALAVELGLEYLDTGAMYRAVTVWILGDGDVLPESWNENLSQKVDFEIKTDPRKFQITIAGINVTSEIRSQRVTDAVSLISADPQVRQWLVNLQREIKESGNGIVMEGRDIGTVVMPEADVKIFINADLEKRAERRASEMKQESSFTQQSLSKRDEKDTTRAISPLVKADDAIEIDTTFLNIEESIGAALRVVAKKLTND